MYQISISEYNFQNAPLSAQQLMKEMSRELSSSTGVDWEFDYRWMKLTDEAMLVANLKYVDILKYMTVKQV
jgi:hypothetical protein